MRRTRHRRRFHTDRIVSNRRRRFLRVTRWPDYLVDQPRRWGYGALADRDPWDCGGHCLLCHMDKFMEPRRARENRAWRAEWDA
jgi:hypothetical protein